jgi:hypothetical protein
MTWSDTNSDTGCIPTACYEASVLEANNRFVELAVAVEAERV